MRQRASPARDIGNYSAYGPEAWNDEVLVGAVEAEPDVQVEAILRDSHRQVEDRGGDAEAAARRSVDVDRPRDRITEADRKGDEGNLERKLQRTLYLLVQGKEGRWEFPAGELEGRESLVRVGSSSACLLFKASITLTLSTGSGAPSCGSGRHQHEYVGCW